MSKTQFASALVLALLTATQVEGVSTENMIQYAPEGHASLLSQIGIGTGAGQQRRDRRRRDDDDQRPPPPNDDSDDENDDEEQQPRPRPPESDDDQQPQPPSSDDDEDDQPNPSSDDDNEDEQPIPPPSDDDEDDQPIPLPSDDDEDDQPIPPPSDDDEDDQPIPPPSDDDEDDQPIPLPSDDDEDDQPNPPASDDEGDDDDQPVPPAPEPIPEPIPEPTPEPPQPESCMPRGSVNWGNQNFQGNGYQGQSAADKMDQLWDIITQVPTVICQQIGQLDDIFDQNPRTSFANGNSDEMPGNRNKLVHQQGLVAQARFVAEPDQPYTGVFEGAEHVLIRMSETDVFVDGLTQAANPSIALKFLRDGEDSANQFGMISFEGTDSWDFFANPFMTHLPQFEGECGPKTIGKFNAQATQFIFQTGSLDMAEITQTGDQVNNPDLPYFMMFVPREGLPVTDENSRWFTQLDGDAIPAGTILFDVMALDEASNTPTPWTSPSLFKIGEIQTKTTFTQSLWGDERLFFSHGRFNDDIQERPEFQSNQTPRFEANEWGNWPNNANVQNVGEQEILEGMAQGCPFNWIIDQFGF